MKQVISLILLVLLAACAKPVAPIWSDLPTAEALLQRLSATTGQVHSLDAAASVALTAKGKFFSSQQFLLLQKPDLLRADVLTGFGQLILQLSSDGEELAVFMNTSVPGRFYRGPATADNLARFTRIPLQPREMIRLLLYDPPLIAYQQSDVSADKGQLRLRLTNSELQQELLFDGQLQLIGCRYFKAENEFLEVLYQKFDQHKQFPQTIRLAMKDEEMKTTIKISELQTNTKIPAERFRLQEQKNIPVEALP